MQSFTPLTTRRPFEAYHTRQKTVVVLTTGWHLNGLSMRNWDLCFLVKCSKSLFTQKMYTAINVLVQTLINTKMFIFIIWYLIYPVQKGICAVCNLDTDWECIFDILIESTMMFKSMTDLLNKLPEVSDTDKISDKFEGPDNTGFLEHIIYSFLG